MRFLVDAQLPPALARMLSELGHPAEHVADLGMRDASDTFVWGHASKIGATIITKDEDFAHRLRQKSNGPVIVWLRVGNSSRFALLNWFKPLVAQVVRMIEDGERLVEIRKN